MAQVINGSNFQEIVGGDKPVVIDFWAEWCGPCRMIGPIIEELAHEYEGRAVVCKCDVDESNDLAARFGVRNIPTVIFLKNGELVDKLVGAATKPAFEERLKKLL